MQNDINEIQKIETNMIEVFNNICFDHSIKYYLAYGTVLGAVRHKGFIPWDSDIDVIVEVENYEKLCDILEEKLPKEFKVHSRKTDATYEELFARVGLRNQTHHSIHIDIFPIAGAPKNKTKQKMLSVLSYINYRCFFIKKVDTKVNYALNTKKRFVVNILKIILTLFSTQIFVKLFNYLSFKYSLEDSSYFYNVCGSYGEKEFVPVAYLGDPIYLDFENLKLPVPNEWDKYLKHFYNDYMTPKRDNYI